MLVSASYQNCKIKNLPPKEEGETSGYHLNHVYVRVLFFGNLFTKLS